MGRQYFAFGSLLLVAVIAAALLVASSRPSGSSGGAQTASAPVLSAASFTTSYESGWSLTSASGPHGSRRYQLSSNGAPVSPVGFPVVGGAAITIDEAPLSLLAHGQLPNANPIRKAKRLTTVQLLPELLGAPKGAEAISRTALRQIALGGAQAGEDSYVYIDEDRELVQVDVLAEHGGRIVHVELVSEPGLAPAGQEALRTITGRWIWH